MNIKIDLPQGIHELGKRDNQEDAIYPSVGKGTTEDKFFILCDGMGGHEHGEMASQTVCQTISAHLRNHWPTDGRINDQLVLDAISAAFEALDAKANDASKKMGTTLTLVVLHKGGCTAAHIGDSRIYHIRPSEKRLLYRSRDHSLVADLYQAGEISYEEMRTSPQKNIITKAMLPGEDNHVKPDIVHIGNLRAGDYLYLCSDGMLERMEDNQLIDIFCSKDDDENKRLRLIETTADNKDNHSAHIIHIRQVTMEEDASIVDDESTSRCNFLNIHPNVVDAVEVDEKEMETEKFINANPFSIYAKYKWMWLLLAAIVALAFLLWIFPNIVDDKAKQQKPPQEKIELKPIKR